jgi:hypothetical protein
MALTAEQKAEMRARLQVPRVQQGGLSDDNKQQMRTALQQQQSQSPMEQQAPSPSPSTAAQHMLSMLMGGRAAMGGAKKGLADVMGGASQYGAKGLSALTGQDIQAPSTQQFQPSQTEQMYMQGFPKTAAAGQFAGESLPMMMLPGGQSKIAGKLASKAPKSLQGMIDLLGRSAKGAAVTGATMPVFNPDDIKGSAELGGAIGAISPIAGKAAGYGLGAAKKGIANLTKKLGGSHSAEEVARNIEALQTVGADKHMPLGEVINQPHLKGVSSSLALVPGSGQAKQYMNVGNAIKKTTAGALKQMNPSGKENITSLSRHIIDEKLTPAWKAAEREKGKLYSDVEKIADLSNDKVDMSSYQKTAKDHLDEMTKFEGENKEFKDIYDDSLIESLKEARGSKVDGGDLRSFGAAFNLDRKINTALENAKSANNKSSIRVLRNLKTALNDDIDRSASTSANKDLVSKWSEAKGHFKENVLPFRNKELSDFLTGKKRAEKLIPTFLKGGQFEQPELLETLTKHLDDKTKSRLAHHFLTKSSRNIAGTEEAKEGKILNTYASIGDQVKEMLFSPEQRKKFDSALLTKKMAGLDLNQMINPKTGHMWARMAGLATGATGAIPIAANAISRVLRSPKVREKYVKQLTEASKKGVKPKNVHLDTIKNLTIPSVAELMKSIEGQQDGR